MTRKLRKFVARHYSLGINREFEYTSLAEAKKFNPTFIEWHEIPNNDMLSLNLSKNQRLGKC
jgi:hypothetical protein